MAIELQAARGIGTKRAGAVQRVRGCATRLSACARTDAALVAELFAWRISLPVLKRAIGITTLARFMWSAPTPTPTTGSRSHAETLAVIRYFFKTGGRLLISPNCLERSLVLYTLLSRADVGPTLVLGARTEQSSLAAHAWIELDGVPLDQSDVEQYARLVAFGPGGHRLEPASLQTLA